MAEFFVIIILLHMSCVLWHDIIPSFDKAHSASHSFKDNPHTLLIFPFLPILVGHAGDVPRRGECREALPYRTM